MLQIVELAHTTELHSPRFVEVCLGTFRQAIHGFNRSGHSCSETVTGNRTTFFNHKGEEIGRTFQHKKRIQCQAGRLLQPHVKAAAKSNVSFDLKEKDQQPKRQAQGE